ncbi:MAG TPA: hypothetical protein VLH56_19385 [Dissulfurispiraceae bacterium]|nr:hypothetical protein [Dissulfurispiraceae bacterium]
MRELLVDWRAWGDNAHGWSGYTALTDRRDALLAGTPAPYPWADGVKLDGGLVRWKDQDYDRRAWGVRYTGRTDVWMLSDPRETGGLDYPLAELRPAPFTPAIGQRVRVVGGDAGLGSLDLYGKDCEISYAGLDTSRVCYPSGTEQVVFNADLMLLADSPDAQPGDPELAELTQACKPRDVCITAYDEAGDVPDITDDMMAKFHDAVQQAGGSVAECSPLAVGDKVRVPCGLKARIAEIADGRAMLNDGDVYLLGQLTRVKPRKWRRYTEDEQRAMKPGDKLKLKGGPVVELRSDKQLGYPWINPDDEQFRFRLRDIAQLKARLVGGEK